jgi:hypothetical protein
MAQVFVKERVNRKRYSNGLKSPQPRPTVIRADNYLAVVSLFVGAAFATFGSGSVEHRFANLLLVGLIPAIGFYAAAYILAQLLAFAVKPCDAISPAASSWRMPPLRTRESARTQGLKSALSREFFFQPIAVCHDSCIADIWGL